MSNLKLLLSYFVICCPIFFSCTSITKEDKKVYLQLNEQLENATTNIHESSLIYLQQLELKTYDSHTVVRAKIWLTKASKIRQLSSKVFNYLENLKKSVKSTQKQNNQDSLNKTFADFIAQLSIIDSTITSEFKIEITMLQKSQDSINIFSSNLSSEATTGLLTTLQNRITILESHLLAYCNTRVGTN
ncbi:unnamed protein product [Rotaria magnacalcarata]|uniref:Gliding motility-associated protein GldM N-terminal domain-containing protein n=1 Tax=Rotaria magnacalcarata TaxID=392030 RepID=A0A816XBS5_9BILA|nr:unnamed protein product [Rotaria magnacalcarata]CAF3875803.1 unnamed protein product [Rotaria magnacalcarata]